MNNISLTGLLTKTPVYTNDPGQRSYCRFSLAVHRRISAEKKAQGAQTTDFIDLVCFGTDADFLVRNKRKGDALGVEGELQMRDTSVQARDTEYGSPLFYADGGPIMVNRRYYTVVVAQVEGVGIRPQHNDEERRSPETTQTAPAHTVSTAITTAIDSGTPTTTDAAVKEEVRSLFAELVDEKEALGLTAVAN